MRYNNIKQKYKYNKIYSLKYLFDDLMNQYNNNTFYERYIKTSNNYN